MAGKQRKPRSKPRPRRRILEHEGRGRELHFLDRILELLVEARDRDELVPAHIVFEAFFPADDIVENLRNGFPVFAAPFFVGFQKPFNNFIGIFIFFKKSFLQSIVNSDEEIAVYEFHI